MSSSRPEIRVRRSLSTCSTTRSTRAVVDLVLECGPPGSREDADGASCTWIVPMTLEESFGQNRGDEYEASPSIGASCAEMFIGC